ncbi:MAG: DUF2797 domain-containing protein [Cryomorphaceae bacterium]|jgi:hypothetical protein|nr:DUF2797 domain-containing protein [Cryomorphaceae bacterium]
METGVLKKMSAVLEEAVNYTLQFSTLIKLNDILGQSITVDWTGRLFCQSCGKQTKKSFGDGFCYPCFSSSAEASECIIRPELCRAHLGEGRDPEWEQVHHNVSHVVYLAATDVVKVGVTRSSQVPTRWIDQGASAAIKLAITPNRYEAGVLEVALKSFFTDKTNWQRMLKNETDTSIDLIEEKWSLFDQLPMDMQTYFTEDDEVTEFNYPVLEYPTRLTSMNFEKTQSISGTLQGIRGQYLIFEGGYVFNVRRHTGYEVNISF